MVESYKPVYVPYIFQLFGDRPATTAKDKQAAEQTDGNRYRDKVLKEESKAVLADLRLKGTGKETLDFLFHCKCH